MAYCKSCDQDVTPTNTTRQDTRQGCALFILLSCGLVLPLWMLMELMNSNRCPMCHEKVGRR